MSPSKFLFNMSPSRFSVQHESFKIFEGLISNNFELNITFEGLILNKNFKGLILNINFEGLILNINFEGLILNINFG